MGVVSGLTKPLIQCTLYKESDNIPLSLYQGLFTSTILVFATIGSPLGVWISNKWGMRTSLQVMAFIGIAFPLLAILVPNFWYVLGMRGILGLALGFASAVCPMYSSTIVDDSVKGRVGSTLQLSITISILIGELMNFLLIPSSPSGKCIPLSPFSWKMQIAFSVVFALGLLIVLFFGPNPKPGAKKVASSLSLSAQESLVEGHRVRSSLFSKTNAKWLILAIMLAIMNQFTGINGVMYYAYDILHDAGVPNAMLMQVFVVGLWNMLTVFIFMVIVDRLSRRAIFMIALSIMLVGTLTLISSFLIKGISVVAIMGMLLFILGFESGPGPLFFVMASQDFPPELVDQGTSVANILMWVLNILIAFFFPIITTSLGGAATFIILAGFQLLCMLYFGITMKSKASEEKVTNKIIAMSNSHENLQDLIP